MWLFGVGLQHTIICTSTLGDDNGSSLNLKLGTFVLSKLLAQIPERTLLLWVLIHGVEVRARGSFGPGELRFSGSVRLAEAARDRSTSSTL